MFYVLFVLALLPQASCRPVVVGATGTLSADVLAPAVEQKLIRREAEALLEKEDPTKPTCETGQVAYAVLRDGDLAVIDMGPKTPSGFTEVHRLKHTETALEDYAAFKEGNPVVTSLHITGSGSNNGEWTFLSDGADNLVGINSGMTASNFTEVHRLQYGDTTATTHWQSVDNNIVTPLHLKQAFEEWEFLLDSHSNLVVIKKGPSSETQSMTEIHMLKAEGGYQDFIQAAPMPTGLHLSASISNHGHWTFLMDGADNLICIKRPTQSDPRAKIQRLTAGSNYASFDLIDSICSLETHYPAHPSSPDHDPSHHDEDSVYAHSLHGDVHWVFEIDMQDDILFIKEGPETLHGQTEIYKLSKASNYTTFTMNQEKSAAACRVPLYTDAGATR